ncbi:uncharacterized protein PV09_04858 [Verruconis gallopava]|uniref:C2H2-type domain-containing protein n=1 Tax=Verruconis gallopava TaxID=253628 RepID=A0A0D1XN85_9PEZI|nr:uncharacterized protein PV09_04858 [Verruconis gallopava]KIW04036.1 hypothetical protein PV09_04858 [Verruconis gallopava]
MEGLFLNQDNHPYSEDKDGANSLYTDDEERSLTVSGTSRPCHNGYVAPQQVQLVPQDNDEEHGNLDQVIYVQQHVYDSGDLDLDLEFVEFSIHHTYTPGDRTYSGGRTLQDFERMSVLKQTAQTFPQNDSYTTFFDEPTMFETTLPFDDTNIAFRLEPDDSTNCVEPLDAYDPLAGLSTDLQLLSNSAASAAKPQRSLLPMTGKTPVSDHRPQELTCDQCGSTKCKSLESLKRHKDREHGSKVKIYSCPYANCPKKYTSKKNTDVDRHVNSFHLDNRSFVCTRCGKSFSRKDNYYRHGRSKRCSMSV